jgi:tRNA modification GTPase
MIGFETSDTIVAISTPMGYSGIGVVRLSGPNSESILSALFKPALKQSRFPDRTLLYGQILDPATGTIVDDCTAVLMRAPKSYTGEDVVELNLHGSPIILEEVVRMAVEQGARPAKKGEFTRRAFLSGKINLIQAESVIDIIEGDDLDSILAAQSRLQNNFLTVIKILTELLKNVRIKLEAHIDFDEDDFEPEPEIWEDLAEFLQIGRELENNSRTAAVRSRGINVVIAGMPNVGKSTLFNSLLKSERTITSPYPGTTRDVVNERVRLSNFSFVLSDTAGLRSNPGPIEAEGIKRTLDELSRGDIVLLVLDSSQNLDFQEIVTSNWIVDKKVILVLNKNDLPIVIDVQAVKAIHETVPLISVSAKTGSGLKQLEELLVNIVGSSKMSGATLSERCNILLQAAIKHIECLREQKGNGKFVDAEILSYEIREALLRLEEMTGENADAEILDSIFERFCVGK